MVVLLPSSPAGSLLGSVQEATIEVIRLRKKNMSLVEENKVRVVFFCCLFVLS